MIFWQTFKVKFCLKFSIYDFKHISEKDILETIGCVIRGSAKVIVKLTDSKFKFFKLINLQMLRPKRNYIESSIYSNYKNT